MSQISSVIMGSTPVSGPVITLTGDTGGPVTASAGNINVVGAPLSNINVKGNITPNNHTLTIDLLNQATDSISTSDNTPTPMPGLNVTLPNNSAVYISVLVIGVIADYSEVVVGQAVVSARKQGAGAVILAEPTISFLRNKGFFAAVDFTLLGGTTVQFNVIGLAATNINWTATRTTLFV